MQAKPVVERLLVAVFSATNNSSIAPEVMHLQMNLLSEIRRAPGVISIACQFRTPIAWQCPAALCSLFLCVSELVRTIFIYEGAMVYE
eukprot:735025-Pelagomonas_calceolata.AAC.4